MASPYPVRAVQRNLHHQLLRSGVLITGSSRAGMPLRDCPFARHERSEARHEGIREELAEAPDARGFLFSSRVNRAGDACKPLLFSSLKSNIS
jgi:hypothetical protein